MTKEANKKLTLFEGKKIRKTWHRGEWFFSIVDVVGVLTDSPNPTDYLKKTRKRDVLLGTYLGTNCPQLEMMTESGKIRKIIAGNTENIFRIIQSIPSPKAEPFKLWLAKVGQERIAEIENPELAQERMKRTYEAKGYPASWIEKRLRGIAVRQGLTDEWKARGISEHRDFAILTAEISKAIFDMTPEQYKKHKNIPKKSKANLRDNMSDLELIFTMLGEGVTTEISQTEKPSGMPANRKIAKRGGDVAGKARKATEKEIGHSVVSKENFLDLKNKKNFRLKS
jgi:hypothetical protein